MRLPTLSSIVACCIFGIVQFRIQVSNDFVSNVLTALGNAALLTILGSRMLFNLKEAGELGVNEGTNVRVASRTLSGIDFAEPEHPQTYDFWHSFAAMPDYSKATVYQNLLGAGKRLDSQPVCSIWLNAPKP